MPLESIKYTYKNIPIPGGGFVTGFIFHPTTPDILYCRTDIGGCYRYDFNKKTWISLIDHSTDPEVWETYPLAIALDKNNPSYVYTMVGLYPTHKIAFSDDYGANWVYFNSPTIDESGNTATFHGNAPGRSTGERLVVDPNNSNVLYLGTPENGLWKTTDRCQSWTKLMVNFPGKPNETNISFIEIDPASGNGKESKRVIVATNGQQSSNGDNIRGQSVYLSNDAGVTFEPLKGEPSPVIGGSMDYPGYVGQRACFLGEYLYISYSAYNIGWSGWHTYGCDTGLCYDGALYRFKLDDNGDVLEALDITPPNITEPNFYDKEAPTRRVGHGISGISADLNNPGTLICSTITGKPDVIYHSTDYGLTWKPIMSGLEIGKIDFNVPYQKPEYNGNASLIHWMSDIKINPFNSDMALFNTGAGIFATFDLTKAHKNETVSWRCFNNGVEETVHLNVYCPPSGDVKVIDVIGDYGCFTFTDLDKPAENTFMNSNKDRWITGMNADFPDANPQFIAIAPRGNWTRKTNGGLIVTHDQGKSWEQLNPPKSLSKEIDEIVDYITNTANVTAGWTAVSADGETIVWGLGLPIFTNLHVATNDLGKTWSQCLIYDMNGKLLTNEKIPFKVMSDRTNPNIFYGFSNNIDGKGFFVSLDKGISFKQLPAPDGFPEVELAGIDSEQIYEIRLESGKEGVIYMAMLQHGLWKIEYDKAKNRFGGKRVSKEGDFIKRIGFGKPADNSTAKTFFTSGTINGVYGFYRSHDEGTSWVRINDDKHHYGDIRSITGDPRVFGRIYIATGTRGLVYGDVAE